MVYTKKGRACQPAIPRWGERWGSNPRQPEPQSGALPTELRSPCRNAKVLIFLYYAILFFVIILIKCDFLPMCILK